MSLRSMFSRLAPAFAVALFLLLMPSKAHAQAVVSITGAGTAGTTPTFFRDNATGAQITKRDQSLNPEAVNLQDCHDDQRIVIPITVAGSGNGTTSGQVWVTEGSGDCQPALNRQGSVVICYRLPDINFVITPSPQNILVPVKDMIAGLPSASPVVDSKGCRLITQTTFSIWFLPVVGTADVTGGASVGIVASTQGPTALTGINALPGDTRITVSWDIVGEGGITNVTGVQAYCDGPNPMQQTAGDATISCDSSVATFIDDSGDAEVVDSAGVDACVSTPGTAGAPIPATGSIGSPGLACTTNNFPVTSTPLIPDSTFDKYKCGSISGTGNTLVISDINGTPLQNNQVYAVAIAATDSFANVGDVSSPLCQFPEMTTDFWRDYKNAGGDAGGGFCSIDGAGMPAGSFGLLAIGVVIGVSQIRRRRRRLRRPLEKREQSESDEPVKRNTR